MLDSVSGCSLPRILSLISRPESATAQHLPTFLGLRKFCQVIHASECVWMLLAKNSFSHIQHLNLQLLSICHFPRSEKVLPSYSCLRVCLDAPCQEFFSHIQHLKLQLLSICPFSQYQYVNASSAIIDSVSLSLNVISESISLIDFRYISFMNFKPFDIFSTSPTSFSRCIHTF
ncbi:hypothetical protein BDQ17DRAFT_894193 [Cyathus striatus]|nr:hypothetical protein BDQ17DRAFT_894193 [Cyathus striatus]